MSPRKPYNWSPPIVIAEIPKLIMEMARVDPPTPTIHGQVMKRIVRAIGWPSISKVGVYASREAALLVLRADHDVSFQARCLSKMNELPENDINPQDIENLEARVRANLGLVKR